MKVDDMLISRFFKNQCTEEEARAVAGYLEAHPERLDELLGLWEDTGEQSSLSVRKKEELLETIIAQAEIKQRRPAFLRSLSIAAALLLILSFGWWMGIGTDNTPKQEKKQGKAPTIYTLVKINYGKEDMKLDIADGSVIYLKPGGELRYPEQLSKQKRDFTLKGVARFKVAEDKSRPFNVYAGGTVTTALGTDFTISSKENEDKVSVLLHSGKVVVRADSSSQLRSMKKTYLLPGNKLLINKANFNVTLIKNGDRPERRREMIGVQGQTELSSTEISFRNQRLDKIFNVLRSDFSAVIRFDKTRFKRMYFTGTFKRNAQTVVLVLNEIALLNHLNIEKRDSIYILKPQSNKQSTN